MKNFFINFSLFLFLLMISASVTSAQNNRSVNTDVDENPFNSIHTTDPTIQTPWQILFNYDLFAKTGANGNAAVCVFGTEIWVSRWATDSLFRFDLSGNLLQRFIVPGVTGTRSLTTDGTAIFAGTNSFSIFQIDPVTKTLSNTINTSVANIRSLTYDATVNSNAGGFWVSSWATDISQVDLSGLTLSAILSTTHGLTGMYGTACDNISPGGPYLWVFDQASSAHKSDIRQINISTGFVTTVIHDVLADAGVAMSDTSGLAGGLFFRSSPLSLVGVLQSSPVNILFAYDISGVSGINDINSSGFINIYPDPAADNINIRLNLKNNDLVDLQISDVLGNIVFNDNRNGLNNMIGISKYKAGIYFVKISYEGKTYTSKFIKQ